MRAESMMVMRWLLEVRPVFVRILPQDPQGVGGLYEQDLSETVVEGEAAVVCRDQRSMPSGYEADTCYS